MFDYLREDFECYRYKWRSLGPRRAPLRACFSYGLIATCVYRYGRWTRQIRPWWLSLPFKVAYLPMKIAIELGLGIDISLNSKIGPGLFIGHFGGIFLHCDAGKHLSVGQGVTLGYKGAGKSDGWPELGDDIYIGAGAKIIGHVRIGDGSVIGANTVVTKDVPAGMRVVGAAVRMSPLAVPGDGAHYSDD